MKPILSLILMYFISGNLFAYDVSQVTLDQKLASGDYSLEIKYTGSDFTTPDSYTTYIRFNDNCALHLPPEGALLEKMIFLNGRTIAFRAQETSKNLNETSGSEYSKNLAREGNVEANLDRYSLTPVDARFSLFSFTQERGSRLTLESLRNTCPMFEINLELSEEAQSYDEARLDSGVSST